MNTYKGADYPARRLSDGNDQTKLTAVEVCEIIKTAAQNGVKELRVGDLEVEFQPRHATEVAVPPTGEAPRPLTPQEKAELDRLLIEAEKKAKLEIELERKRSQLDNMAVEDPAQYEEAIASGDLVDGQREESDDQ